MTMFGGVPISVTMPPRIEAKESGISVAATARFAFFAASISRGMRSASAATLFTIAESPAATIAMIATWSPAGRSPETRWPAARSIAPEFISPRETIRTSAMMMTAGWPKPAKISPAGTTPASPPAISPAKATKS